MSSPTASWTPEMFATFRDAFTQFGPLTRSSALDEFDKIQASMERRHAEKLAKWKRDAPMREAAARATALGYARRAAAESGSAPRGRVPVLAMWADEPVQPKVW
jgi:hypothetical protein